MYARLVFSLDLTRKFALLFTLIGLLCAANGVILYTAIDRLRGNAATVNVAGTLRWISQRAQADLLHASRLSAAVDAEWYALLDRFESHLGALLQGGTVSGMEVGQVDGSVLPAIESMKMQWTAYRRELEVVAAGLRKGGREPHQFEVLRASGIAVLDAADQAAGALTRHYARTQREVLLRFYLLLAADLLLLVAAFVAIRRRVVRPLASLAGVAQRFSVGDYSARSGHRSSDEIGLLTQSFDVMAGEIEQHIHQIERDNAEIRTAREALRRLAEAVEQSPAGVVITGPDGKVEYVNPRFAEMTGFPAVELVGRSPRLWQSGKTSVDTYRQLWSTIGVGRVWHGELLNRKRDGQLYWQRTSISPLRGERGRINSYLAVTEDITPLVAARRALKESEERFRSLTEMSSDWYWEQDDSFRWTLVSGGILKHHAGQAMIGKARWELPNIELSEEEWAAHRALLELHRSFQDWTYRIRRPDGEVRWYCESGTPLFDETGKFTGYRGVGRDITERRRAEERLRLRERALEASVNGIILIEVTPGHPIIYANEGFARITGYANAEIIGRKSRFLFGSEQDQPEILKLREAIREGREAQVLVRSYRKDGTAFWNELTAAPVHDAEGGITHFVTVFNDVTERVHYQEELERQATHDSLTGLANRTLLSDRLEQALARAQRQKAGLGLAFVDLDHFKYVNDSLGHAVGDKLIQSVGLALSRAVREVDTVARVGGDEFVVVLSDMNGESDIAAAIARISGEFSAPYLVEGHEIHAGCSIGVAVYPKDGDDVQELMKRADVAMYRAKENGRGRYEFYRDEMDHRVDERISLESALRRAVEREELELHFQPCVDLRTGVVVGAEALLRWHHPDLGHVPPGRFIPVAEETGLIVPLGEWVMAAACAQASGWRNQGRGLRVAVNISASQFRHSNLFDSIHSALESSRLDPDLLELELTETMVMRDPEETVALLMRLQEMGVGVALDDFGTGYSSLNYLKRFPIHGLKIDYSFVKGIATDRRDAAIVRTIINLARSLSLMTVAEGVETAEQAELLASWGCDRAQGYHFGRPISGSSFTGLFQRVGPSGAPPAGGKRR